MRQRNVRQREMDIAMNAAVWVTGASGFIGSQLVRGLSASGIPVVGFGRRAFTTQDGELYFGGKLDDQAFKRAIEVLGPPGRVLHFAGGSTVGASLVSPLCDFESNVHTTVLLLEFLRCHAPDAGFMLASSAAVYGAGHHSAVTADSTLSPLSPYGHHKWIAERLVQSYVQSFNLKGTILRIFSVYGPSIRKQLLYDACFRLSRGESPLILGGTGDEVRDWLHVDDAVRSILEASTPAPGMLEVFNVASGTSTSIRTIASLVCRAWGNADPRFSGVVRLGDPERLYAHPSSLLPNFAPRIRLEEGLIDFVHQFKVNHGQRV